MSEESRDAWLSFTYTVTADEAIQRMIEELGDLRQEDMYAPPDAMRCPPGLIEEGQVFL